MIESIFIPAKFTPFSKPILETHVKILYSFFITIRSRVDNRSLMKR